MPEAGFLKISPHAPGDPVVFDANTGEWFTRARLEAHVAAFAGRLQFPCKALGFNFAFNDSESLISYLAALEAGHAVVMLNPEMDELLRKRLIDLFQPDFIVTPRSHPVPENGYTLSASPHPGQILFRSTGPNRHEIHPELSLLNSTSGSTGSPKLVRLAWRNQKVNAGQINHLLRSTPLDRTMTTAPIFNAYGQSVIHTMLTIGGSFVLSNARIVSRQFWDAARETGCNAIGGTSYFYELLDRLDIKSLNVPLLTKFAHSGGRLPEHLALKFHEIAERRGGTLHLMYGQAETTARISGLPPEFLPEAHRSVGLAVPGGTLRIERDGVECPPFEDGEVIYEGPNVMMGYANSAEDLARGDELGGRRATGDVGHKDERGLLYITGRRARFVKLYGWRVSLDDVEELLAPTAPAAAVNENDRVVIYTERPGEAFEEAVRVLAGRLNLHPAGFEVRGISAIPRLANQKIDYKALARAEVTAASAD